MHGCMWVGGEPKVLSIFLVPQIRTPSVDIASRPYRAPVAVVPPKSFTWSAVLMSQSYTTRPVTWGSYCHLELYMYTVFSCVYIYIHGHTPP